MLYIVVVQYMVVKWNLTGPRTEPCFVVKKFAWGEGSFLSSGCELKPRKVRLRHQQRSTGKWFKLTWVDTPSWKCMPISLCNQISLCMLSFPSFFTASSHMRSDDIFTTLRSAHICWQYRRNYGLKQDSLADSVSRAVRTKINESTWIENTPNSEETGSSMK